MIDFELFMPKFRLQLWLLSSFSIIFVKNWGSVEFFQNISNKFNKFLDAT